MSVAKLNEQALSDLIKLGKYEAHVDLGQHRVYFDLADTDKIAKAEMFIYRKYEGFSPDFYRKAAILAASIKRFGDMDFEEEGSYVDKFSKKYDTLVQLQQPILEFLWTTYVGFRRLQEQEFEDFIKNIKKS